MQVLFTFSQLSARYSSVFKQKKHSGGKSKNVRGKECSSGTENTYFCRESFEECLRNFDKDALSEMRKLDVRSVATCSGLATRPRKLLTDIPSSKKVSYISSDSFITNKNGWETPTVTVDFRRRDTR